MGGIITIICGVLLAIYATIILSSIIRRDKYNLDLQTFQTQTYDYKLDPVTNKNSTYLLDCKGQTSCNQFTIENLFAPIFEETHFVVEFPRDKFTDYSCLGLKASLRFYNESGEEEEIMEYGGDRFIKLNIEHLCYFHVNISEVNSLPKYQEIKVISSILTFLRIWLLYGIRASFLTRTKSASIWKLLGFHRVLVIIDSFTRIWTFRQLALCLPIVSQTIYLVERI